jgi:hypothetical protein
LAHFSFEIRIEHLNRNSANRNPTSSCVRLNRNSSDRQEERVCNENIKDLFGYKGFAHLTVNARFPFSPIFEQKDFRP